MNTELPLVSIVISAYNQKDYLKQAIDSVLGQNYPNKEIIVADDCSTDGTKEMMQQYSNSSIVRYFRNPVNLGAGYNGCYAFYKRVRGEFTLVLNHDDYLTDDNYLSDAVQFLLQNPNVAFVFAKCSMLMQKSGEIREVPTENHEITNGREYFLHYEEKPYNHVTSVLTSLFRTKNAKDMKCFKDETKSKDLFLYLKLMLTGDVGFINRVVGVYRIHDESISYNMPIEYDYSTLQELERLKEIALSKGFSQEEMQNWIDGRVYSYIMWRVQTLISQKNTRDAMKLISSLENKYPAVYDTLSSLLLIAK